MVEVGLGPWKVEEKKTTRKTKQKKRQTPRGQERRPDPLIPNTSLKLSVGRISHQRQ